MITFAIASDNISSEQAQDIFQDMEDLLLVMKQAEGPAIAREITGMLPFGRVSVSVEVIYKGEALRSCLTSIKSLASMQCTFEGDGRIIDVTILIFSLEI